MPAGDLDASFAGNGKKRISFGGTDEARAVLVQPNGRIVVAGGGGPAGSFCVARLRANGNLDTTFGSGGKRVIRFGGDREGVFGAARQPDGKIVLVGDSDFRVAVARLNANGSLDTDFGGGDGRITVGAGSLSAVFVQADRKIVVAGNAGGSAMMTVTRLRTDGSPDTTFDGDGTATIYFGSLADVANDAVLQGDGKIVVAGFTQQSVSGPAIARLNANGSPDATFGAAGNATVDFGVATFGNAVALQPNGRIVIAGQMTGVEDFAVAR